jgi:putative redox protein
VTVDTSALETPFQTRIAVDVHAGLADTRKGGVGGTAGLRPHELLEAADAACLAITARMAVARMAVEQMGIPNPPAVVRVSPDRSDATTVVNSRLTPDPRLDDHQHHAVAEHLGRSPLRRTLTLPIEFAEHGPAAASVRRAVPPA